MAPAITVVDRSPDQQHRHISDTKGNQAVTPLVAAKTRGKPGSDSKFQLLACFSRLSVCRRLQPVDTDVDASTNSRL